MNFDIKEWCDMFKSLPTEPMTDTRTKLMLTVMMGGVNREKMDEYFMYKVINGRAEALGLDIDQDLKDFLALMCISPGDVTMYVALLRQEQAEGKEASMDNFIELFPNGFPNREDLGDLWDVQKEKDAPCGNALDLNLWTL